MNKTYKFSEVNNIESLPEESTVVLDDRHFKLDPVTEKIVRPGEPGYDDLPEIVY